MDPDTAETCSVTPTNVLGGGAYTWWVQTWNPAGYGPWSARGDFSTDIPTLPAAAILTGPAGTTIVPSPTYQWNRDEMATSYRVYVSGPTGVIYDQWHREVSACNATVCSVTPEVSLANGSDYTWWVQTWNSAGYGPWSSMNFTITADGFYSNFDGSTAGWDVIYDASGLTSWSNTSNTYWANQIAADNTKYHSISQTGTYTNLDFQARVKTETEGGYGFLVVRGDPTALRDTDKDWDGYSFGFDNDGQFSVWKRNGDTLTTISGWTTTSAIVPNDWNIIRVVAYGDGDDADNMAFFINGTRVWYGSIPDVGGFDSGRVGIQFRQTEDVAKTWLVDWAALAKLTSDPGVFGP